MVQQKRIVAVFMPEFGVWREVAIGFHEAARNAGWGIWTMPDLKPSNLDTLRSDDVHAVLVGSTWHAAALNCGLGRKVVVAAEADLTDRLIPSVRVDDAAIGHAAADHLLDQGHRDFSGFGWPLPFYFARLYAFEQRVLDRGGRFHARWNPSDRLYELDNHKLYAKSILTWIRQMPRPIAILAGADNWGRILNLMLYRLGIRVPEDVAVIGVDNEALACSTSIPPLSSVAVPWRRVGSEAASLMATAMASTKRRSRPAPLVLVPPSGVVVRQSSDMIAVSDPNVSDALRLIWERATGPLSVPDILRHVPIGRHALQRAFRRHVGRTIVDEIQRVRIERAKSVLATTDLPMPEVALRSGFASATRLGKTFRRETGTTPGNYRRMFTTVVSG